MSEEDLGRCDSHSAYTLKRCHLPAGHSGAHVAQPEEPGFGSEAWHVGWSCRWCHGRMPHSEKQCVQELLALCDRYRQALLLVQSSRYSTALSSFVIPAETMREVDRALTGADDET